jgi:hypothetical protein
MDFLSTANYRRLLVFPIRYTAALRLWQALNLDFLRSDVFGALHAVRALFIRQLERFVLEAALACCLIALQDASTNVELATCPLVFKTLLEGWIPFG